MTAVELSQNHKTKYLLCCWLDAKMLLATVEQCTGVITDSRPHRTVYVRNFQQRKLGLVFFLNILLRNTERSTNKMCIRDRFLSVCMFVKSI